MTKTMSSNPKHRIAPGTINYLTDLVRDRDVKPGKTAGECLAELTHWLANPATTQKDASDMIDRVKKLPKRAAPAPAAPAPSAWSKTPYPAVPEAVPSAKFAVLSELLTEIPGAWRTQEYLFFEVKKLHGRRVIRKLTGAPGRFNRTAIPAALASELYGHLEDEKFSFQASKTFGEIYSVCGRCAAELTDDQSRERKFGPVCWDLMETWRKAAGV